MLVLAPESEESVEQDSDPDILSYNVRDYEIPLNRGVFRGLCRYE